MNSSLIKTVLFIYVFTVCTCASDFPKVFSATGDNIYENIAKYKQIMSLKIYQGRPELLEAFCIDANETMQKGFALDAMKEDPEAKLDKAIIKSYVKELRRLSDQNEAIASELQRDMQRLVKEKNLKALKLLREANISLSASALHALNEETIQKVEVAEVEEAEPKLPSKAATRESELAFYKKNLLLLKEELYALRESNDEAKMACLNDITAIDYWMIKVLENQNDACDMSYAIKQMKSYDKTLIDSCGKDSMRYVEWHGRIKPYVGKKLFEAEAECR